MRTQSYSFLERLFLTLLVNGRAPPYALVVFFCVEPLMNCGTSVRTDYLYVMHLELNQNYVRGLGTNKNLSPFPTVLLLTVPMRYFCCSFTSFVYYFRWMFLSVVVPQTVFWEGCVSRLWPFLGPVVQSFVSLTSSVRVISLTVSADSIYNILIFFAEKMWVAFAAKATQIFSAKNFSILAYHSM